jgi:hypothetical protein
MLQRLFKSDYVSFSRRLQPMVTHRGMRADLTNLIVLSYWIYVLPLGIPRGYRNHSQLLSPTAVCACHDVIQDLYQC